ncbi:phytanoyl-CoA dioxygenase family protein [Thalassotalea agariperforans]
MQVDIKLNNHLMEFLNGKQGYFVSGMSSEELNTIKSLIEKQYSARILNEYKKHSFELDILPMNRYHLISESIEHKKLWPKSARILGPNAFETVTQLPFFQALKQQLNIKAVATEEGCGWQEMYWRIVRPGGSDIGDFHADRWFWDLGHGEMPEGMRRLKIWLAIDVVKGKSGLCVIPGSHLKHDWQYHGEVDHTGIAKPKFDEDISQLDILNVPMQSGDFIVFHDDLIHRGMVNHSDQTRVSLEATLLIPET